MPVPPVCAYWDATAQGEQDNLYRDYFACNNRILARHAAAGVVCGAAAIICCSTSLIPNPISIACCGGTILCLITDVGADVGATIEEIIELDRVRGCICTNAVTRHNGGTTGSCTFTCPNY
jgi:hypothetical protein